MKTKVLAFILLLSSLHVLHAGKRKKHHGLKKISGKSVRASIKMLAELEIEEKNPNFQRSHGPNVDVIKRNNRLIRLPKSYTVSLTAFERLHGNR